MRELAGKLSHEATINPATLTATTNGTGVDGKDGLSVTHIVHVGESVDTLSGSVYWTFKVQDSADNSTWADAADADVIARRVNTDEGTNAIVIDAAAEDDTVLSFGYIGAERYSRVVATATGTHTNGTPIGASALLESRVVQPAI